MQCNGNICFGEVVVDTSNEKGLKIGSKTIETQGLKFLDPPTFAYKEVFF